MARDELARRRISRQRLAGHSCYARCRDYLKRVVDEQFALFLPA